MESSLEEITRMWRLANFAEDLRKSLICHLCKNYAQPEKKQWYRCMSLHYICGECERRYNRCTCGYLISVDHCLQTEQLLDIPGIRFNCPNTRYGCAEVLAPSELEDHKPDCLYRIVPCLANNATSSQCDVEVTFKDVIEHFERHHYRMSSVVSNDRYRLGKRGLSGLSTCFDTIRKIVAHNRLFLLCGKTEAGQGKASIVYRWVYLVGSPKDAKNFVFRLRFRYANEGYRRNKYEGPVVAIGESFDKIAGHCFALPHKSFITQYVDDLNMYQIELRIRNLKDEAKDETHESGVDTD